MAEIELLKLLDPAQLILLIYMFYQNSKLEKDLVILKTELKNLKERF